MVEKTTEQRLQEAEYRIKILTELLYRVVDSNSESLTGLDKQSSRALWLLRDGYRVENVAESLDDYAADYRFFHKLGDTNE